MAQSKFTDMANRLGNNPKGLGTGIKVLAAAGAVVYGVNQSMFTGNTRKHLIVRHFHILVKLR